MFMKFKSQNFHEALKKISQAESVSSISFLSMRSLMATSHVLTWVEITD